MGLIGENLLADSNGIKQITRNAVRTAYDAISCAGGDGSALRSLRVLAVPGAVRRAGCAECAAASAESAVLIIVGAC